MKRNILPLLLGSSLVLLGCPAEDDVPTETGAADDDSDEDEDEEDTEVDPTVDTQESASTMPTSASDTDPDPSDTDPDPSDTDATSGPSFLEEPDGGGVAIECDVWEDDCPEGEKCMPWANDGGNSWNATRCSPVDPDAGEIGDPCMVEGSGVSGVDDCTSRSMCYYVEADTNQGVCIGFCSGTPNNPTCDDPDDICTIVNDGVLTLCRPRCDPLLQECEGETACLPATGSQGFTCIIDASGEGGAAGDACEFINSCDPGLACADAAGVPNCLGATGCCAEFCDLDDGNPDAACSLGGGSMCVSWWDEGAKPPGLEHVGLCVIPS